MTRVRNADEFLQKFRGRRQGYEKVLVPLIARVRDQYIDMTGSEPPSSFDDHLEIHLRVYLALLHDSTAARVGALFQLLVQDTTAQDFGLPSSAIRLRM